MTAMAINRNQDSDEAEVYFDEFLLIFAIANGKEKPVT
jgi:hypothetical protein